MHENRKGLGFGIFLLTAGIIWLLFIAKIITLSTLYAVVTLWPLILVATGVGIIFRNSRLVRTASWLVLLAVIILYGHFAAPVKGSVVLNNIFATNNRASNTQSQTSYTKATEAKVTLEKLPETEKGELILHFGATQLFVDSETSDLLDANVTKDVVQHSVKSSSRSSSIEFEMKGYNIKNFEFANNLRQDFHLNKDVVWKLNLDIGAVDCYLDMAGLKIDELDIDTGASKLKLDMGSYNTELKIDAGASKIDITLPKDTGIKLKLDGGLNSTNLNGSGWVKKGDWHYSPEYDSKEFKIEADITLGLGNLTVEER